MSLSRISTKGDGRSRKAIRPGSGAGGQGNSGKGGKHDSYRKFPGSKREFGEEGVVLRFRMPNLNCSPLPLV